VKFGLIGKGYISQKHIYAIEKIGGKIVQIYDPILSNLQKPEHLFLYDFDYLVICSPSFTHYEYLKMGLKNLNIKKIICEKPLKLPWEPVIDDDRINVVLQYRWLSEDICGDRIDVRVVRDENYFKSWKGNPMLTGGIFLNIFIHYIDLAIIHKVKFKGCIESSGEQYRKFGNNDLQSFDANELYYEMYKDIIFNDNGVKPKDLFYLDWVLNHCNWKYGMGKKIIGQKIEFDPLNLEED